MRRAFTLIELLVVISIIALLVAILLPALGAARQQAQIMQNATHMRGINQAFMLYAMDNDEVYPGLVNNGTTVDRLPATIGGQFTSPSREHGGWPSTRFGIILMQDYVSPDYLINPADPNKRIPWTFGYGFDTAGTVLDWRNFSYAVQEFGDNAGNRAYLREQYKLDNLNGQMPIVGDRIVVVLDQDYDDPDKYIGVYSPRPGKFKMGLAWGDGHTTIETSAKLTTKYGRFTNQNDNIYQHKLNDFGITTSPAPPAGWQVQTKFCYYRWDRHQSDQSEWP